jgi:G patch domain-containing protein 1
MFQRGEKLGEEPIKAPLKSVFEYMSEKSKERLAEYAASKKEASPPSPSAEPTVDPSTLPGIEIPPLSPRTASAALMGFIPFGDDPAKQERYRSYLLSQTHNTKVPQPKLLPSTSVDHINKELQDFSKSANIFKPMSFAMANRFTSSKASAQDMKQPAPGLHMPDPDKVDAWQDKEEKEAAIQEVLTPKQEAARSGMYGNLTRTVEDWYPNKLLCKRFGVADPHPDGPPGKASTSTTPSAGGPPAIAPPADLAWTEKYVHKSEVSTPPAPPTSVDTARQPRTLAEVGLADDENQGKDILTYKKPSIDIFRAIFQDDDSSDDDDDDDGRTEGDTPSSAPSRLAPAKLAAPSVSSTSSPHAGSHSGPAADDTLDQKELPRPIIFQAKSTRDDDDAGKPRDSKKSKSKKDKERKKNTKILMSFDVGDDEEADASQTSPKKESSKRKRDKQEPTSSKRIRPDAPVPAAAMVEPDDDEWVEKEIIVPPPTSNSTTAGRKRASDFL